MIYQEFAYALKLSVGSHTPPEALATWFAHYVAVPPRVAYLVAAALYAKMPARFPRALRQGVPDLVREAERILRLAAEATDANPYVGYDVEIDIFNAKTRQIRQEPPMRRVDGFPWPKCTRALLAGLRNSLTGIGPSRVAWLAPANAIKQFVKLAYTDAVMEQNFLRLTDPDQTITPQTFGDAAREQAKDEIAAVCWSAFHPQCPWLVAWDTSAVRALALGMYEKNDFSAAPILADALIEAGCEDALLLASLQNPLPDTLFRGCWVIDKAAGRR